MLKVGLPHDEGRPEADALAAWDGAGAVRLVAADRERWGLLLERCAPGTALAEAGLPPRRATQVAGALARRLWIAPPAGAAIPELAVVAAAWAGLGRERAETLPRGLDAGLIEAGLCLLGELPLGAAERVVLHGDLNPTNVLAAAREPWLAIDPKPMIGDPAYDLAPMAAQLELRVTRLAEAAGVEAERVRRWAVARHVESALWLLVAERDPAGAGDELETARGFARAAGL